MNQNQEEQLEINWNSIFRDLMKSIWILVLAAMIGILGAFSFTRLTYHPMYSSSATFVAELKNSGAYAGLNSTTKLAVVFKDVMGSEILENKAAAYMEKDKFPGKIHTEIIDSTNLFIVTVTSDTPQEAFNGIQAIIAVYPEVSDYLFQNALMNVISVPKAPTEPSNPPALVRNMALGMIGMVALCGGIIVLISLLRDTVKSERNVRTKLDTSMFGAIIHEKKRGRNKKVAILLNQPGISVKFRQCFQHIRIKLEYMSRKKEYKVFMITSAGENEGKSTVAANVALSLAQKGKSVLLIDADLRKLAMIKIFDKKNSFQGKDFGEYLQGKEKLEDTMIYDQKLGMYMLLTTKSYEESTEMLSSAAMLRMLDVARSELDYVIIDTAPMLLTADAETLAEHVDASILVIREDVIRTRDLNDQIEILNRGHADLLGCIYNDASRISAERATSREYQGYSGQRTAETKV